MKLDEAAAPQPDIADRLIRVALLLFWILFFLLGLVTASIYPGSVLVYCLFSVVSALILLNGFRPQALFFDTFLGVLLWLGFWMKFSFRTAFMDSHFLMLRGIYDGSGALADQALLVASTGMTAFLIASVCWRVCAARYFRRDLVSGAGSDGLVSWYLEYREVLLFLFVFLILFVAVSNVWLGLYQRGQVPRTVLPYGLNGVYAWLLQFGLASASAVILHCELALRRRVNATVLGVALFEAFSSSVSMLSRGMILNAGAVLFGLFSSARISRVKLGFRGPVLTGLFFLVLFASAVLLVNYLRASPYSGGGLKSLGQSGISVSSIASNNQLARLGSLVLDRWVGIEGVLAVSAYPDKGRELWSEAWNEAFDVHQTSFFDRNLINSPYVRADHAKHHYISLPGIIAFFYYPGSYVFLFCSLFVAGLAGALTESLTYRFGGHNLILCALIAQVVAYRYTSFGYVPARSYMLFGALGFNVSAIWFLNRLGGRLCPPSRQQVEKEPL